MASETQFDLMLQFHYLIRDVLMEASCNGNIHIVQWALNTNPEYVSVRDVHGQTVLSWAMCVGNLCLVQWLVNEAVADVMATD